MMRGAYLPDAVAIIGTQGKSALTCLVKTLRLTLFVTPIDLVFGEVDR